MAGAGDVNADGPADVIIGAHGAGFEHVAAADALVCEAIRGLAQASTVALERISSSDGQRYPIIGRSALAGFAAREAGYRRRMVTWMIWINEQYAHFGSKVISVTEREGLHTFLSPPTRTR